MVDEKFRQELEDACDRWVANFCKKELRIMEEEYRREGPRLQHFAPNSMATPNSTLEGSMPVVLDDNGNVLNATVQGEQVPVGDPEPVSGDPTPAPGEDETPQGDMAGEGEWHEEEEHHDA